MKKIGAGMGEKFSASPGCRVRAAPSWRCRCSAWRAPIPVRFASTASRLRCTPIATRSQDEICEIVKRLAANGVAIAMIPNEVPKVLYHSHRALIMHGGRLTGEAVSHGKFTGPSKLLSMA